MYKESEIFFKVVGGNEGDCYDNMPHNLADMFERVIRESDANPQIVIEKLKNAFEYD